MKPKNFPARKLARQISAELRARGRPGQSARELYEEDIPFGGSMTATRQQRSKKRRAS